MVRPRRWSDLKTQLEAQAKGLDFVIHEKLLILVSTNADHEYLIRSGRQIADRRRIPWLVVWVDTGQAPTTQGTRHRFQPWRKRLYRQLIESGLPLEVSVIRPARATIAPKTFIETKTPFLGNRRGCSFEVDLNE